MRKDPFPNFQKAISDASTISIITHWSPDGDAMGSSLGLYHFLIGKKKNVKVIVPNEYPAFLKWLPGNESVLVHQTDPETAEKFVLSSDLIFTLDFNTLSRIEKLGEAILANKNAVKAMVDHHQQPDDYAQLFYHDVAACSTCELIYELICGVANPAAIDKKIATCLYTGIMTDSGNFRFRSVTASTHRIVAGLIEAGADNSEIYSAVQDDYSESRMRLVGYCLNKKMIILPELRTGYICLTEEELNQFNFEKGDTEGLVNYALSIRGIIFSAFFQEKDGIIKTSFRSKGDFDVNLFARENWNGGGHRNAAGGAYKKGDMVSCEKKFLGELESYKEILGAKK
jgi:bifunctional oligoribonuclease and PAP phosphatase NrnA